MDKEVQNLKTQITALEREKSRLEKYEKRLQATILEIEKVKNLQIQKAQKLKSSTLESFGSISSSNLLNDAGEFIKDHVMDRHVRDQALSFRTGINEIKRYNTSLARKIDSLKRL